MARLRRPAPLTIDGVPVEIADQRHPLWRDIDALTAHPVFGAYVDHRASEKVRLGGRAYHHVVSRWAQDHGFMRSTSSDRLTVDWPAIREAAGIDRT